MSTRSANPSSLLEVILVLKKLVAIAFVLVGIPVGAATPDVDAILTSGKLAEGIVTLEVPND